MAAAGTWVERLQSKHTTTVSTSHSPNHMIGHCTAYNLGQPVFQDISDRRGMLSLPKL